MKPISIILQITFILITNCLLGENHLPLNEIFNKPFRKDLIFIKKPTISLLKRNNYEEAPKQVIKLNIAQLTIANISLQYEYGFHKNMSGALGVSFLLPRSIPELFLPDATAATVANIISPKMSGFAITPEFRFYPGEKEEHQAPHGFYVAPYLRYSKFKVATSYVEKFSKNSSTFNFNASYSGVTCGLMLGAQWLIGKHFSIDWWIVGAGAGKAKLNIDAYDSTANLSPTDQDQLKKDATDYLSGLRFIGADHPVVRTTSKSFFANVSGMPMFSYRGGLCLGFSF